MPPIPEKTLEIIRKSMITWRVRIYSNPEKNGFLSNVKTMEGKA